MHKSFVFMLTCTWVYVQRIYFCFNGLKECNGSVAQTETSWVSTYGGWETSIFKIVNSLSD